MAVSTVPVSPHSLGTMVTGPRVLTIDLERLPGRLPERDVWHPRDLKYVNYIHPDTWLEQPSTLSFSWTWNLSSRVEFAATWTTNDLPSLSWELFDEADHVITYNGARADLQWLAADWLLADLVPPSPFVSIDLFKIANKFGFTSRSLRHLAARLNVPNKDGHYNADEARAAHGGDVKAQKRLERYNKQDVRVTNAVYERLGPWATAGSPHAALYGGDPAGCPSCGSTDRQRRGVARTKVSTYPRFQCSGCGAWYRGTAVETVRPITRSIR